MSHDPSHNRRTVVIKKALQYRFTAWVLGTVLAAVAVVLVDVIVSLRAATGEGGMGIGVLDLYDPASPVTLAKVLLYLAGVFLASLLLSHRVAGPLYHFERSAQEVGAGDLTHRVFLRDRDELVDLRNAFNEMVDALRNRVAGDMACAYRAKKQVEVLLEDGALSPDAADKLRRALSEMERVGKGFRI